MAVDLNSHCLNVVVLENMGVVRIVMALFFVSLVE